ncbi:MAG: hypothetical protein GC190_20175 [Alphaproteobacteria bacterium]|nr:hypothetical protein [Alphaproteobacteria bacterium]
MTTTANRKIAAGVAAAQNPESPPPPDLALALSTQGDFEAAISNTDNASRRFADLMAEIDKGTASESAALVQSFSRSSMSKVEAQRHVDESVTKFQREKLNENADAFREQVKIAKQWGERALVSLQVLSSPASLLTQMHGLDSSPEYSNLVTRLSALGFAGFRAAAADIITRRDEKGAAALIEVLNSSKNKREMAAAAGVSISSVAELLVGETWRKKRAALLKVVDSARLLEDAHAAHVAFMSGRAGTPNISPRAKLEHGLRLKEIERLLGGKA